MVRERQRVVAMACLLFAVSTAEGGRAAWLEDVIVAPDRRGAGVGAKLLSGVIEEARRLGCRRLTLLTDGDNTTARRFYARAGFQLSHMVPMRLKLAPG